MGYLFTQTAKPDYHDCRRGTITLLTAATTQFPALEYNNVVAERLYNWSQHHFTQISFRSGLSQAAFPWQH